VIQRSKNQNIVVYEAKFDESNRNILKKSKPIDVYWLDIDPEYVKANRAKGIQTDRCELNYIDTTMAYGLSFEESKKTSGEYIIKLVSVPDRPVRLFVNSTSHAAFGTLTINKKECRLRKIYVMVTDSWIGLPKVEYIELYGVDLATGEQQIERLAK